MGVLTHAAATVEGEDQGAIFRASQGICKLRSVYCDEVDHTRVLYVM